MPVDHLCCFVSLCYSTHQDDLRCGKPGVEFTTGMYLINRFWYCAEHWDMIVEEQRRIGLLTKTGRPWYDHSEEYA